MSTGMLIVLIAVVVVAVIAGWILMQKKRTQELRGKFGPEYDHLVRENGNARRAEDILEDRQKRVNRLPIRRLSEDEREHFAAEWRRVQERFVDNPKSAVAEADALVSRALKTRGYPIGSFEQRAADVSVEHPRVVEHYRIAHEIAVRGGTTQSTTEELRLAMQHYRHLFEHVLEAHVMPHEEIYR